MRGEKRGRRRRRGIICFRQEKRRPTKEQTPSSAALSPQKGRGPIRSLCNKAKKKKKERIWSPTLEEKKGTRSSLPRVWIDLGVLGEWKDAPTLLRCTRIEERTINSPLTKAVILYLRRRKKEGGRVCSRDFLFPVLCGKGKEGPPSLSTNEWEGESPPASRSP